MSMDFASYLSQLDENSLLDLASLYLGRIPMPFSRAGITESLMHFFSSTAVKENLISGVCDDESRILSLISIFGPIEPSCVRNFFSDYDMRYVSRMISSLIRRTLLLCDEEGKLDLNSMYDYTPLVSLSVFSSWLVSEKRTIFLRDTLRAFYAIRTITSRRDISKTWKYIFPRLDSGEVDCLYDAFLTLGEQLDLFDDIGKLASFFAQELDAIKAQLLSAASGMSVNAARMAVSLSSFLNAEGVRKCMSSVFREECAAGTGGLDFILGDEDRNDEESTVYVCADFTIRYHSCSRNSIFHLYTFPSLVDTMVTLEINRDSIRNGFDCSLTADDIISSFSGCKVSAGVENRIRSWWDDYNSLRMYDCIYLETSEDRAGIISRLPLMKIHIIKRVGSTGFLMRKSTEKQWRVILTYSGFDMLGKTVREESGDEKDDAIICPPPAKPFNIKDIPLMREEKPDYYKNLLAIEIRKKASDDNRDAYLELLSAGYILSESQIVKDKVIPFSRSISGFNFQSKLSFIKKNIARNDALFEITTVDEKLVCSFEKLEGDGAESILSVLDEDGGNHEIPVSRIFKIKEMIS